MKNFIVTAEFVGLTGAYRSRIEVRAKNPKSAGNKARLHFGNRNGSIVSIIEAISEATISCGGCGEAHKASDMSACADDLIRCSRCEALFDAREARHV